MSVLAKARALRSRRHALRSSRQARRLPRARSCPTEPESADQRVRVEVPHLAVKRFTGALAVRHAKLNGVGVRKRALRRHRHIGPRAGANAPIALDGSGAVEGVSNFQLARVSRRHSDGARRPRDGRIFAGRAAKRARCDGASRGTYARQEFFPCARHIDVSVVNALPCAGYIDMYLIDLFPRAGHVDVGFRSCHYAARSYQTSPLEPPDGADVLTVIVPVMLLEAARAARIALYA